MPMANGKTSQDVDGIDQGQKSGIFYGRICFSGSRSVNTSQATNCLRVEGQGS